MAVLDDRELARPSSTETLAFNALVASAMVPAYRFACSVLLDRQEAEDAVQDAALNAWRHFARYDPDRPFQTWFFAIVANNCRSKLRSRWWSVLRQGDLRYKAVELDEDAAAIRSDLARAILQLPPLERSLLVLRYYHDFTIEDIAVIAKMSPKATKSRIYRAIRRIRPTFLNQEAQA
jgi:RNA polymerase sigma-70 factor, ECF subfamily